jgi:hypothetical protein
MGRIGGRPADLTEDDLDVRHRRADGAHPSPRSEHQELTCPYGFPPRGIRVRPARGRTNEASEIHGRADHCGSARARSRSEDSGTGSRARRVGSDPVQLEGQVWRHERIRSQTSEATRDENAKLKKLLAEAMLDASALRELLSKKW